ncbi:MAG: peptidoglycan DD-metalloendopeptidase family protein [Zoogloeaceae bacterium]|nr:peptidoglycan DD-metalloendopeptidase family protein [Zoogloeaceae bacterium]
MNILCNSQRLCRIAGLLASVVVLTGCLSQVPAPVRGESPGAPTARSQEGVTHEVRPGETLLSISRAYNRTLAELVSWNGLTNPNQIRVGQRLRVAPPDGSEAPPDGVIVQPIDLSGASVAPASPQVLSGPVGGTVPYTDQAWAAVNPRPGAMPSPAPAPVPVPSDAAPSASPPKAVPWQWPASGQVIDKFDEATNKGIDIAGKPGDPVHASAAGSVAYAGSGLRGYGKLVIINHDGDYYTAYAHNQTLLVKEGDKVTQGQKIAEMGSTDADRPKLHFEIRRQGRPVDPMQYLPAR